MAVRSVVLNTGSGPDRPSVSGEVRVRRYFAGPTDDGTYIHATDDDVTLTLPAASIELEVGEFYYFTPVRPSGKRILAEVTPGEGDLLFKDLVPVDEASLLPTADPGPAWFTALTALQDGIGSIVAGEIDDPESLTALSLAAKISADVGTETTRATTAEDALKTKVDAWTPTGVFSGAWSTSITANQGDQVVHDGTKWAWASSTPSTSGDVPGSAAGWVALPDVTVDPQTIPRLKASMPGVQVTNLATIPVPHPSPAPSTGWGHGGTGAGVNSRVGTGGPSTLAPAFYRRTFSAAGAGTHFIYGTSTISGTGRFSFRMNGRASWAARRLVQISWRDSSNVEIGTYTSPYSPVVPANEWRDLVCIPTEAPPAGTVSAAVRYCAEVGGQFGSAVFGADDFIDGTAIMIVAGVGIPPFATGDSNLSSWDGVAGQSTSTIYSPARTSPIPRLFVVSPMTGAADYTRIADAQAALSSGDTIEVWPGVYREQISGWSVANWHLIGVNKRECIIIDSASMYSTPPLEIGSGTVKGLTIIEDHTARPSGSLDSDFEPGRAYSIHPDHEASMVGRELLIEDVILQNTERAAIGGGLYQGTTVTLRNVDVESGAPVMGGDRDRGAIYFHNRQSSTEVTTDQHLILDNVRAYSGSPIVFGLYDSGLGAGMQQSVMDVLAINCTLRSAINGSSDAVIGGNGFTANVTLHPDSRGNNVAALNA